MINVAYYKDGILKELDFYEDQAIIIGDRYVVPTMDSEDTMYLMAFEYTQKGLIEVWTLEEVGTDNGCNKSITNFICSRS